MRWTALLLIVLYCTGVRADSELDLTIQVYNVADLVVQPKQPTPGAFFAAVEGSPHGTTVEPAGTSAEQQMLQNLSELSLLLQSTILPSSWEMAGGQGRVSMHGNTCCLVVAQYPEVHAEIASLLDDLRREQDLGVFLTIELYSGELKSNQPASVPQSAEDVISAIETTTENEGVVQISDESHSDANRTAAPPLDRQTVWERIQLEGGVSIAADELAEYRDLIRRCIQLQMVHRFNLQNGRPTFAYPLNCTAVVSANRRSVRLMVEPARLGPKAPLTNIGLSEVRLADGQGVVLPLLMDSEWLVAVIRAEIVSVDEDESLIGARRSQQVDLQSCDTGCGLNMPVGMTGCMLPGLKTQGTSGDCAARCPSASTAGVCSTPLQVFSATRATATEPLDLIEVVAKPVLIDDADRLGGLPRLQLTGSGIMLVAGEETRSDAQRGHEDDQGRSQARDADEAEAAKQRGRVTGQIQRIPSDKTRALAEEAKREAEKRAEEARKAEAQKAEAQQAEAEKLRAAAARRAALERQRAEAQRAEAERLAEQRRKTEALQVAEQRRRRRKQVSGPLNSEPPSSIPISIGRPSSSFATRPFSSRLFATRSSSSSSNTIRSISR
ncbi:MAG: hypothetical protein R3B90_20615 [Planctomycetaceae bacterium]